MKEFDVMSETMDIYSPSGTKIIFTGLNGGDYENKKANAMLTVGKEYTVVHTDVGGWMTRVYISEAPGYGFNSVHFVMA